MLAIYRSLTKFVFNYLAINNFCISLAACSKREQYYAKCKLISFLEKGFDDVRTPDTYWVIERKYSGKSLRHL